MLHWRGPNFGVSRLNICVKGKKLHTLYSTRADPIYPINALKSMFLAIN